MAKAKKEKPTQGAGKTGKAADACPPDEKKDSRNEKPKTRSVGIGIPVSGKEMARRKRSAEDLDE